MIRTRSDVPGLTPAPVCAALSDLAGRVPVTQAIVEIGVHRGRTLCYLATGRTNDGPVYGVDPWDLPGERPPARLSFTDPQVRRDAQAAVHALGLNPRVTLIRGFSAEVAASWRGELVGLLHVDGAHDYDSVLGDVTDWYRHLAPGAIIAFDDYAGTVNPHVAIVVDELVADGTLTWDRLAHDRLAITRVPT